MGGLVNTSIRFKDGEIINRIIYTGGIASLFSSRAFYYRDKKIIKDLLKKISIESDKENIYREEKCEFVAPSGYGLIVADFMSDLILDMQDYCMLDYLNLGGYDFIKNLTALERSSYYQEELKPIVELFLEKRVLKIGYLDRNKNQNILVPIDENLNDLESVYKFLVGLNKKDLVKVYYDTGCIIEKVDYIDYTSQMNLLTSINYPLNQRDISIFNELIKERDEVVDEEEDE